MNIAQKEAHVLKSAKSYRVKGGSLRKYMGLLKKLESDMMRAGKKFEARGDAPVTSVEKKIMFNFGKRVKSLMARPEARLLDKNPYGPSGRVELSMVARRIYKAIVSYRSIDDFGMHLTGAARSINNVASLAQDIGSGRYKR